ncbi:MAG: PAS domain S-box protein [Verrucomicrobiota bacterium]
MSKESEEEEQMRTVALANAKSILAVHKRAEQELIEAKEALQRRTDELIRSLALMRATLNSTTDGLLVLDEDGQIADFNKKLIEMWRIPPSVFSSRDVGRLRDFIAGQIKIPQTYVLGELSNFNSAGKPHLLELNDGRLFEQFSQDQRVDNRSTGRVLCFRDVTERKQSEEAVSRLAAVVESSDDAIISKTLEGIITSWNAGAQRIFGYEAEEILGRSILVLIPPELQDEEPGIIRRLKKGERIEHYQTVRLAKDGRAVDISLSVSPIKDRNGRIIGASKIARDITEDKKRQRALRESEMRFRTELERLVSERTSSLREAITQMEEFSYSVSHDLRAPLRAMQGYATALLEDYRGKVIDEEGQEYLQRIVTAGLRMDRLTRDVLVYSRIPRTKIKLQGVALDTVVSEIVRQYLQAKTNDVEISIEAPLLPVVGNESFLSQAVSNLVDNAVKFSNPDRALRVRIWTEARQGQVRLWVEDNGIGIRAEHQARIWGMFERIHPLHMYDGTGIGLAIVRKTVERMNGTMGVESDGAAGSRFWIQLPGVN